MTHIIILFLLKSIKQLLTLNKSSLDYENYAHRLLHALRTHLYL